MIKKKNHSHRVIRGDKKKERRKVSLESEPLKREKLSTGGEVTLLSIPPTKQSDPHQRRPSSRKGAALFFVRADTRVHTHSHTQKTNKHTHTRKH